MRDGRIVATGDDRSVAGLAGPGTRTVELAGRTAIPGFVESHNHPVFLGPDRARRISPLASARSAGVRFGLHSDTPITPVPPLEGIWCAVNRRTRDGAHLGPEQAVDVDTALRGYTIDAAFLAGEDGSRGSLEVGKLADLAVLSADPTTVEPDRPKDLTVDATVVGGRVTHARDGGAR